MGGSDRSTLATLRGVRKQYGAVHALRGVDLSLRGGELLALLGPNGAGKTTAIALLLGLLRADRGEVALFGRDPQDIVARRHVGVMLQDAQLPPTLTVGELLRQGASYYPSPRDVGACAVAAGVDDLLRRRYGKLSGGQQRRVQFALALVGNPRLLFLDEPTVGLDLQARQGLWRAIRQLVAEGCGVVLTTHYLEEAEQLCRNIAIIDHGTIVENTSMRKLLSKLHVETFYLDLQGTLSEAPKLDGYPVRLVDDHTLEVQVDKSLGINGLFVQLNAMGHQVLSLRNKSNRLEELFVSLVAKNLAGGQ